MLLYHGSSVIVRQPELLSNQRALDFGAGFYTTSDLQQAKQWAERKALRLSQKNAFVSCYQVDETLFQAWQVLLFETADERWLDFIVANRTGKNTDNLFDLIIGKVANDKTISAITYYINGIYNKQETIHRLLPQKLSNQYVFKTQKSINQLHFTESIKL
ncbi:MAG: DUF3990 domain-containing protein [Neisseriaceae bacterium]|nr:DUF3990 domain-containing protein [Neisseriaceae bacterium]